jgi:hypothetical protein
MPVSDARSAIGRATGARFNQKDTDFVLTLAPNGRIFSADPKIAPTMAGPSSSMVKGDPNHSQTTPRTTSRQGRTTHQ